MSGDRYYITDQHAYCFLTFTVVEWVDVFTRPVYKETIVESLNYCIAHKGLECNAWVLMTNHLHLIVRSLPPARLSDIIRDFKKFTSKKIVEQIKSGAESRKDWLLHKFEFAAQSTAGLKTINFGRTATMLSTLMAQNCFSRKQIIYMIILYNN